MFQVPLQMIKEIHVLKIERIALLTCDDLELNLFKEERGYGLFYLLNGKIQVTKDHKIHSLEKHDFLLLSSKENIRLSQVQNKSTHLLYIDFFCDHQMLDKLQGKILQLTLSEQELVRRLLLESQIYYQNREAKKMGLPIPSHYFANEQMLFLSLEYLLIQVIRRFELPWQLSKQKSRQSEQNYPAKLQIILDYLALHLHEYLSLEQICKDNGISQSKLHHLFKKHFDKGVIAYFTEMKIEMAKDMIQNQEMNFTQISDQLGYSSIHYFSRQFKQVTGQTPTHYLKSLSL